MALGTTDRQLWWSAWKALISARITLWFGSFDRVRRQLQLADDGRGGEVDQSRRVARAVDAVGDAWPGLGNCLVKAVAAVSLLRRHELPGSLCIGVARSAGGGFEAHAWVECGGEILLGGDDLDRFTQLEMVGGRSFISKR